MAKGSECLGYSRECCFKWESGKERVGFLRAPSSGSTPSGDRSSPSRNDDTTATIPTTNASPDGTNPPVPSVEQRPRGNLAKPQTIQLLNVRGLANNYEPGL